MHGENLFDVSFPISRVLWLLNMGRIAGQCQTLGAKRNMQSYYKIFRQFGINRGRQDQSLLPGISTAFRSYRETKRPFLPHIFGDVRFYGTRFFTCQTLTEYLVFVDRVDIFYNSRSRMGLSEVLSAFMEKKVTKIKVVTFTEKGFRPKIKTKCSMVNQLRTDRLFLVQSEISVIKVF